MADVDFRVKFPYKSNIVSTPIIVDTEEPIFTLLNRLDITDNLPAGLYCLTVNFEWQMSDVNDSAIFRILSPITQGTEFRQEPKDPTDVQIRTFSAELPWAGGQIALEFEGSITSGGQALIVNNSQIILERKV